MTVNAFLPPEPHLHAVESGLGARQYRLARSSEPDASEPDRPEDGRSAASPPPPRWPRFFPGL